MGSDMRVAAVLLLSCLALLMMLPEVLVPSQQRVYSEVARSGAWDVLLVLAVCAENVTGLYSSLSAPFIKNSTHKLVVLAYCKCGENPSIAELNIRCEHLPNVGRREPSPVTLELCLCKTESITLGCTTWR